MVETRCDGGVALGLCSSVLLRSADSFIEFFEGHDFTSYHHGSGGGGGGFCGTGVRWGGVVG